MTRARFAQLVRELAEAPPDLLRGALLSLAAALDVDEPANDAKPRRRRPPPAPIPLPPPDEVTAARARAALRRVGYRVRTS